MKNILKKGLLSVALIGSIAANASEKIKVKVAETSKMLAIELTNVKEGETISIKDLNGAALFSENLKEANEYTKVFSLSTLPEGLYFVESEESSKIVVTPVIISKDGVALVANATETYLAPEISIEGDVLKVMVRNYPKVPVSISIYSDSGSLLTIAEDNTNTLVFGSYKITDIKTEKLTVSVSEGDHSFIKEIKL